MIRFALNGAEVAVEVPPTERLSLLLRDGLLMILGFALGAVALGGVLWTVAS